MNVRTKFFGNLCLLATLGSMQLAAGKHDKKHSQHSSKDTLERKVDHINHNGRQCCRKIVHDINKIDDKLGCAEVHVICSVPAVIDKPGKWCVKHDLVYKGSGSAITVTASNVTLNFNNHSLTLTNPQAVGVYAQGVQELTVENDIIQSSSISTNPRSKAFHLINCEKVTLDNIFTANTFFGVHAVNSRDVFVTHSRFKDHIGGGGTIDLTSSGLRADTCNAVVVEESTFSGAGTGAGAGNRSVQTIFRDGSTACRISNCEFTDIEGAVLGYGVDGLVIENCITQTASRTFDVNDLSTLATFRPAIQLGSTTEGGVGIQASNVTVRNCLINGNANESNLPICEYPSPCIFNGSLGYAILISQAQEIQVEGCEVSNFLLLNPDYTVGGGLVMILSSEDKARSLDITIKECTLRGGLFGAVNGIQVVRADIVSIERCNVIGTFFGFIPQLATNVVFRDSTVDGTGACSVDCFTTDGLTVANNHILGAGEQSIRMEGIQNVIVEGNTLSNGVINGAFFRDVENGIIRNNTVNKNNYLGIVSVNSANLTIQGNICNYNGTGGVAAFDSVNMTIQENICNHNGVGTEQPIDGIGILGCTNTTIIGNTCNGNIEAGIWIGDSTETLVQDNTTSQNGIWGIIDTDNAGEVAAFFNKSCTNGVANCVDIPYMQLPGTPSILGANLCCNDPNPVTARVNTTANTKDKSIPGEPQTAPDPFLLPKAAY